MNWLHNIKEKSAKLIHHYKSGFNDFVVNLNDDISSLVSNHNEDDSKIANNYTAKRDTDTKPTNEKNYQLLKEILDSIVTKSKSIGIEELAKIVDKIEKQDNYLRKDPSNLVLIERDDFTNFTVFYETYQNNKKILDKLLNYHPKILKLIPNDQYQPQKQETINRFLLRYLYLLIYTIETIPKSSKPLDPLITPRSRKASINFDTNKRIVISNNLESDELKPIEITKPQPESKEETLAVVYKNPDVENPSASPSKTLSTNDIGPITTNSNNKDNKEEEVEIKLEQVDNKPNDGYYIKGNRDKPIHKESDDWQLEETIIKF